MLRAHVWFFVPLAFFIGAGPSAAQEFRATLSGRVVDAQGAAVPAVKIVITQMETGAKSETLTGNDGLYTMPYLAPGSYQIAAEARGFKRYIREGINLSTNERLALEIVLEVGALTESVMVRAEGRC